MNYPEYPLIVTEAAREPDMLNDVSRFYQKKGIAHAIARKKHGQSRGYVICRAIDEDEKADTWINKRIISDLKSGFLDLDIIKEIKPKNNLTENT